MTAGLIPDKPKDITIVQRSGGKIAPSTGITTRWITTNFLKKNTIKYFKNCYIADSAHEKIILKSKSSGKQKNIMVKTCIVCIGQEPNDGVYMQLKTEKAPVICTGAVKYSSQVNISKAIYDGYYTCEYIKKNYHGS
jgi:hypothetical protein